LLQLFRLLPWEHRDLSEATSIEVCSGCPGTSSGLEFGPTETLPPVGAISPRHARPEELKQRTIDRVRRFLKAHVPMRAAAQ